jgi:pimeloyl-ACP methyl ester carboxylesterase
MSMLRALARPCLAVVLAAGGLGLEPAAQSPTPATDPPGAFAEVSGRMLWYRDTGGAGVPIVLLHAGTGSALVWEHQFPAFAAAGYRVIAYDRLGFGRSSLKPGAEPGTSVDDLEGLVQHLRIPRLHLVGTAAGGGVALDYALTHPQRLRSLVIANSVGAVQDAEYLAMGRRMRPPAFNALPPEVRELGPSYRAGNPEGTSRWVELEERSNPEVPLSAPQRGRNRITFALLETLRVPTLLLTGDADLYTPPAVLRIFAERIRGAETLIVPETGHSAYWEQPEIFNRAVLEFIARH